MFRQLKQSAKSFLNEFETRISYSKEEWNLHFPPALRFPEHFGVDEGNRFVPVWSFEDEKKVFQGYVLFHLIYDDCEKVGYAGLKLQKLFVPPPFRRQRFASKAMKLLCEMADDYGTPLMLTPQPLGNKPINEEELTNFYQKFGFGIIDERQPELLLRTPMKWGRKG